MLYINSISILSDPESYNFKFGRIRILVYSGRASEAILLKKLWIFYIGKILVEIRIISSAGRQWMIRIGGGGLKYNNLRILWLQ